MDPPPPIAADHHLLPAANPTPTHLPTPSHPPYAEMIITAITVLNSKNGSSKKAIVQYVTQAYGDRHLPPGHLRLLTHHLKRLKSSGELIMVKKSYKINKGGGIGGRKPNGEIVGVIPRRRGRPPRVAGVVPRRRGRPPKVVGVVGNAGFWYGLMKRRPGRPRKEKVENGSESVPLSIVPIDNGVGVNNGNVAPVVKRGRGRPLKYRVDDRGGGSGSSGVGLELVGPVVETLVRRGRGRPRKDPNEVSYLKPVAATKRRGRPPLIRKVGPKRRGRPPLIRKVGAKWHGRPPENAAALLVPGRLPVGRPKKNAPVMRNPLAVQADELTRKLEFMQACIKSAPEFTAMRINPAPEFTAPARLLPVAVSVPPPVNTVYH